MDLDIRQCLTKAKEQKDTAALRTAYNLIREATAAGTSRQIPCFAPELYVLCAEEALQLGCLEISKACLKMYFEGKPPANQFLCRAYLCLGQLKSPSATGSVEDFEKAVLYFLKAIEISKDKPRYHFVVFNASVLYFQTVRPLLQPGRRLHLVPSLRQVVRGLEEVAERDHSWRAELMMHLVECLVDSGKMEDARSFAKVTAEFIETHTPHLYPKIFTLLVQHKLSESGLLKMTEQSVVLAVIYKMQELKNRIEERKQGELKKEDAAKLKEIFHLLVDCTTGPAASPTSSPHQSPTPIPPADRVAFLLELAVLALQMKHQEVAADCLKELKLAGEATVGQCIIMECVQCELSLLKKEGKMNDYSKACVEVRLKEIGKLDQWLQSAVREGDPRAMQAVCATQWSFCLPLLQHNLRRRIKAPLLRVAQVLEDIQSMLLETRCQAHSELAVIEEEEGRLEASLTHLEKAMLLDQGMHRERLSSALHLLRLRGTVYQTPARTEDKAAMLLQQARDMQPQDMTDSRPMLVNVGLLLAPDAFQMVLDADNTSKIAVGSLGSGPVAQLSAKAQHHSTSVQRAEGHLSRQGDDTNNTERVKLWAALVKTARKQEVWDVCRAACRFCLLYDDGRWKITKTDKEESYAEGPHGWKVTQSSVKDLLRLLVEIHFINAEATIHKLRAEGIQLNGPAVPPEERGVHVSEDDPHWAVYREWIQELSAYATSSFQRAAELGAEIREPWVVANTAVYLWNYNSHLLAAGEHQRLLPTFQRLVEMLRKSEHTGDRALFVLLCDAVARGFIQPLCGPDSSKAVLPGEKAKNRAGKGMERTGSVHGVPIDPAALQDARKALELCDYALRLSNCTIPGENVPIAARKQVVATWVQIKRLLQQQIGPKMETDDECKNELVSAMTRVLVGVEMLQCNSNPRQMEFSVPSLSTLVRMASDCSWTDAVVELQVWSQLAAFCHHAKDHSLVSSCTQSALQLESAAAQSLNTMPCVLYGPSAVNEMLSSAACLRGLSLVHESNGDPHSYREAMKVLLSSVSYAEKAGNPVLCMAAARHYWNTCLPLTQTPVERLQLQEPLEKILNALAHTNTKHANKQGKVKGLAALTTLPLGSSEPKASNEDDLTLRAAIYSLLFYIHTDRADWKTALQLLDKAIRDMPQTRHRLPLLKHRVLVRARLGQSVLMDMQKFKDEGELCCSLMWHRVAPCAGNVIQQLACYQNSITSLLSAETQWQKMGFLLEFGEWLYCQNFPKADAQHQIQWAIDILLHMDTEQAEEAGKPKPKGDTLTDLENSPREGQSKERGAIPVKRESLVGVQGVLFTPSLFKLREVRRLDGLVRAHTLLAVMADRTSPQHQLNLLRAYTFVLQTWQVSMATVHEVFNEMSKSQPTQPPPSTASKKDKNTDKDKGKGKKAKEAPPAEEKPKRQFQDEVLPTTTEDWARYSCPDQARQTFKTNSSPHCINTHSITKQTQSLFYLSLLAKELHSLSLTHLTLPIMHLAETIAHDLLDRRSLSDLYRLRIVRICCQLGVETYSPYCEKLLNLSSIQEQEQMGCRKAIALVRERRSRHMTFNQKSEVDDKAGSGRQNADVCAQDIWLDKAEVCLSMGLYQPARQLLAEAHLVATELGDQIAVARSLLSLAILACEEQQHAQALALLDRAQALGGDEEFWYQLTLTMVRATVGQRDQDAHTKIDQIVKQGCGALKLVQEQQLNRVPELRFLIMSLEMRGAVECIHAIAGGEPGETLCTQAVQRLMAACDTLRESANGFIKLDYREQAAEAHAEYAQGLRILASHSTDIEGKRHYLLDAYSQMQLAVTVQEHVVLNAQSLLPPQEESHGPSLAAMRRLLRLRLALADFSLAMLEQLCAEEKSHALVWDRKASVEIALEEFTRCTPDPNSTEQEWVCVGRTLGQAALGQLAAVSLRSLDNVETRARCLGLMGKCLRLLAVQKDPLYPSTLWDRHNQEAWTDPKAFPVEDLGRETGRESSRIEPRTHSAKSAELQRRRRGAQQLLAQASETLAQAITLCLQHKLPSSILADACLNMLECHGQFDPVAAGQYLALFQSCCSAAMMAEVLSCACSDTGVSQLSALLGLRRKLLLSQEERPSSMLKGAEDSLNSLSKAYSHLTINPNHLNILGELPPNLKILLLQHTEDGSELYGAFYEKAKPTENQKGKAVQITGTLTCCRVAKVSVSPRALLALRERTLTFGQETRHALLKEACWHGSEGRLNAPEERQKSIAEEKVASHFREIVQDMEDYLHPILTQFDFSCFRHQAPSISVPETTKPREKEEKGVSSPMEPGEYVVLLADRRLLELPLEALSVLQEEGLSSVSRDFSLQLLHSRLHREEPEKVESDNKKETKGGKGAKGKGDQSKAIKVAPVNRVLPPNAFPVDTRNFKYIVDPYNEGNFEGTCTVPWPRMKKTLETHSQHFTPLWEGLMGSKQTPSLSEVEQLLCKCSAFIYLGMERFMANVPPAKLAALNLSECRLALLFDLVQNSASILRQSNLDMQKSAGQLALEKPLETAVLLSLAGVGSIVLNQWHSSPQRNTQNMEAITDNLLRVGLTSGRTIHALRKGDVQGLDRNQKVTGSYDVFHSDSKGDDAHHKVDLTPSALNCILYGLPNLIIT
ncbi:cilia- and flagella-associated protein 46 [Centroberyx affinis]|uniref:cilia- and flagella-associated protein 46 n=1 Tax=Centroberyx affinis TaxID=166261 RepID=UPI003A5C04CA